MPGISVAGGSVEVGDVVCVKSGWVGDEVCVNEGWVGEIVPADAQALRTRRITESDKISFLFMAYPLSNKTLLRMSITII